MIAKRLAIYNIKKNTLLSCEGLTDIVSQYTKFNVIYVIFDDLWIYIGDATTAKISLNDKHTPKMHMHFVFFKNNAKPAVLHEDKIQFFAFQPLHRASG